MSGRPAEYAEAFAAEHARPVAEPARRGIPEWRPYVWGRSPDARREAEVRAYVAAAHERARELVRLELRRGAWWIPAGFTEAQLDAIP